jgi:mannose-6-phosphate isomerase-like protein (cupin superfamily)
VEVRCVTTAFDENNRSVFVTDEKLPVPEIPGVGGLLKLWSADGPVTYPNDGTNPGADGFFPPVGGYRFTWAVLPPGYGTETEEDPGLKQAAADISEAMEHEAPGFHTTDTTDVDLIVSGEGILELDDGAEVRLSPGDVVVQNGTRHRWKNPGTEPLVLITSMVGAHRR